MRSIRLVLFGLVLWAWFCPAGGAQATLRLLPHAPVSSGASISASAAAVLRATAERAGVIFAGQVMLIDRQDAAGFVDVHFRVESAIRDCSRGDTYVLREWAGLWSGQFERYRTGQQLLMLLAPRGRGGMSAPVGGPAGAIPLIATRQPPLLGPKGQVPAETPQDEALNAPESESVDLRWIEAIAQRPVTPPPPLQPASSHSEWRGTVHPLPRPANVRAGSVTALQATSPSLTAVIALLAPSHIVAVPVER